MRRAAKISARMSVPVKDPGSAPAAVVAALSRVGGGSRTGAAARARRAFMGCLVFLAQRNRRWRRGGCWKEIGAARDLGHAVFHAQDAHLFALRQRLQIGVREDGHQVDGGAAGAELDLAGL